MLRGYSEDRVDELALTYRIALTNPADLAFADCMHRLVTLDRTPRPLRRAETQARRDPLLDEAMILLDNVVQIRRGSATTAAAEFPALFQVVTALAYAGWPSTLITRGGGPPADKASRRNNFAATKSRLGDNMNSIVSPAESTARYK